MTLYTTDYLEYYLTLVAWVVNNGIWSILVASGVFALPFVAIVIQEWLKARSEGADEGNKGVLSSMRIENRVWVAIVVIMFAGIPFIPVDLATIKFDTTRSAQCQVNVPLPNDTGWSNVYTALNDQSALVPVWWFFMHALSKAVTGSAVAAIPCGTDLRQIRMDVDAARIDDPVLAQEVADFTHDCYGPSRAKLFMNRPTLSDEQMNDVTWIGSSYFLDTFGRTKRLTVCADDVNTDPSLSQSLHLLNGDFLNRKIEAPAGKRDRAAHASVAWLPDKSGFYYTRYPRPGSVPAGQEQYHRSVYFHRLGTDAARDELVFAPRAKEDWLDVDVSEDGRYLLVTSFSGWSKSELYLLPLIEGYVVELLDFLESREHATAT